MRDSALISVFFGEMCFTCIIWYLKVVPSLFVVYTDSIGHGREH